MASLLFDRIQSLYRHRFNRAGAESMRLFMSSLDQPVAAPTPSFWSSIREALRGSHQDFTVGNLNRAIILLAIPMVLEMVLESLFAVVDVFWVGRLGADAEERFQHHFQDH